MSKKCVNCSHCKFISYFKYSKRCNFGWEHSLIPSMTLCNEKNKDGKCKHYQRKWWKFWVKTGEVKG